MNRALLDILACPVCHDGALSLEGDDGRELTDSGMIKCSQCESRFPIVKGIPRLLPAELLEGVEATANSGAGTGVSDSVSDTELTAADSKAVLDTQRGYDHQHVELRDPTPQYLRWRAHFERHSPLPVEEYHNKMVLDVGCGEGRHAYCASECGASVVGMDLSRGIELTAERLSCFPKAGFVQADIYHLPFKKGVFDIVYSIGVLHHTPKPLDSFLAIGTLVKPGGLLSAWVYGLDGMSWLYRVSHVSWLRPLSGLLPKWMQLSASVVIAALLEIFVWWPCKLASASPAIKAWLEKKAILDSYRRPFISKVRAVYDRFQPAVTHYLSRKDLEIWLEEAGLVEGGIRSVSGRGWLIWGRAPEQ